METNIKRISYTADGKRKSNQFTLRSLIPDNLIENNFATLHTDRIQSAYHPQILYADKIRQKLYPSTTKRQNKRIQMRIMSSTQQNRLIRNKSENLRHATLSKDKSQKEHVAIRPITVSKENKMKMKKTLGRINLLASKQLCLEEDEQIEVIFGFLDCLSKNENFYQQAFAYLTHKLRTIVFMSLESQAPQVAINLRKVSEISSNREIKSSVYRSESQKVTYKDLMNVYAKEIIVLAQNVEKQKGSVHAQINQYQNIMVEKQQLVRKLTQKLNFYQSHPSQNKYPELMELKEQNIILKKQIEDQLFKIRVLDHNLQILHETRIMNENKIDELKRQISRYELQKLSNIKKGEKSSELKLFQDNVTMLKEMLDKSVIRMGGMKEEYNKLKDYNETLIEERDNLSRRAAVGFGQLTPRPNLKNIFENHGMNINDVFDTQDTPNKKTEKKKMSTEKFVDTLIGKFKDYYQTYKIQEKSNQHAKKTKKVHKQKKDEEQKKKDIFDIAMDEVHEAKIHIKKTAQSIEQVRNAYSRRQADSHKK